MKRLLPFLLLFTATAASSDPAEEVRCREISFSKSVEQSDLERFRSHLDDDARFVSDSVLRGPDAVTKAWSVFFTEDGPTIKWRPQIVEVLLEGKLALSRGPYRTTATDDEGAVLENWGTFNSIWRLHPDGQWRVVFDAGSPAAQSPSEEAIALLDGPDSCPSDAHDG